MKGFYKEMSHNFPAHVYILYGEDEFLLYEAFDLIKKKYYTGNPWLFTMYDFADPDITSSLSDVIDEANTMPMFDTGEKVMVIRNLQKVFGRKKNESAGTDDTDRPADTEDKTTGKRKKELSALNNYISGPSACTKLFIFYQATVPAADIMSKAKHVKSVSLILRDSEINTWISRIAEENRIKFTGNAIEYLKIASGGELGLIYSEIIKYAGLFDDKKILDIDDIKEYVYFDPESNAFALADFMLRRDKKKAFSEVFRLEEAQTPVPLVVGGINWKLKQGKGDNTQLLFNADIDGKSGIQHPLTKMLLNYFYKA
jgi:DNA polymerase III delta subunit